MQLLFSAYIASEALVYALYSKQLHLQPLVTDSPVSVDADIEPAAMLHCLHWQSDAPTNRHSLLCAVTQSYLSITYSALTLTATP